MSFKASSYMLTSKILFLEEKPETNRTLVWETSKYLASAFAIAILASPLTGGSLTQTSKLFWPTFSTFSTLESGLALTFILIGYNDDLKTYPLPFTNQT